MAIFTKFQQWTANHNPKWLALIRAALGAALLLRGVNFLDNPIGLQEAIDHSKLQAYSGTLATALPWIHIVGGFLIIIGLYTRLASVIQMPVLLGAVVFINSKKGFFTAETDLSYSIILFLLLLVFAIEGSGSLSLGAFFREDDEQPAKSAA
jgi:putative oxidoreductase